MNDVTTSGVLSPASYQDFIASKLSLHVPVGFAPSDLSRYGLFDFQSAIVDWAVKRGRAAIFADTGLGKALDSKTNVITPYGYQPIGSLKPGDFVIGSNGKPTKVIGVFPQGIRPSYKVTFSDETSVICDIEHLWAVRAKTDASRGNAWKILTLKQIMDIGLGGGGGERQNRWFIPSLDSPAEFIEGDLPIHPYVLGALLGDGHIRGGKVSISSADEDIINRVNDLLPNGYHAIKRRYSKYDYDIAKIDYDTGMTGNNKPHHISDVLKEIGVYGLLSLDKFIPDVYKFSNTDTRLEILRGLFDTDGSVWMTRKCPVVEFSTSSYRLACDVQFIIQSLGGKTKIKRRSTKCNDSYRLIPSFPLGINPFYLPRKANLYKGPQKYLPRRSIRNIERIGDTDMTCIKVDAEDELFVVENFIVTHNTRMQLAWADQVATQTGKPVIILAPLCVAQQTVREAERIGIADCRYARTKALVHGARIVVVNYEMLEHFAGVRWGGVVLDESSILKSFEGKTRNAIISQFADTDYRLSCTATPSPNDFMELGNQAEFLGVMSRTEMLAQFFIHDGGDTSQWRLKGHGKTVFWQWMSTWAACIRSPADLGFDGSRYILPPLNTHQHTVDAPFVPDDQLFSTVALTLNDRRAAKRVSIKDRVKAVVLLIKGELQSGIGEIQGQHRISDIGSHVSTLPKWVIWCHLNPEQDALESALKENGIAFVSIRGATKIEEKIKLESDWRLGSVQVMLTKPSVFGFGMNWQCCSNVCFVGLDDSYEAYYQAVRRCYRFGQTRPVEVHIISSEGEGAILKNIERKAAQAQEMSASMVEHMREFSQREIQGAHRETNDYERAVVRDEDWTLHLGDCVDVVSEMESNSIGYTVFSPPFASLYTYSNSTRDMGNSRNHTDFYQHFRFLVDELLRVTKDGRLLSFHCTNIPMMKGRDGQIGIHDFRGELIKLFVDAGWIFHSEVVIWKDPVTAMQRTKALGLLYKQLRKDSCMSRMGIPDYLVTMRKPGVNHEPVTKTHDGFPVSLWQKYASPVWMDVNPTMTLQYRAARDNDDERHICPLQIQVIERAIELWSNPGDVVCSPFAGIGSEGYVALQMGRRFVGAELKRSYFEVACRNLVAAKTMQGGLFAENEESINAAA